ncbi:MAG: DUF1800 domain-containing protein [Anaerolineae bacterium]|nr:DUF1800 domain-containing protein [Anaerolineae bacterium]
MTHMTRRRFLQYGLAAVAAGAALNNAAEAAPVPTELGPLGSLGFPWRAREAGVPSFEVHVLSRMAFGHTKADLDAIQSGAFKVNDWFEAQLAPDGTENDSLTQKIAGFQTLDKQIWELLRDYPQPMQGVTGPTVRDVINELLRATLLRKLYSKWQLKEVLVDFWTDHFNINMYDDLQQWGKSVDDREVIRRHALGNFHAMLLASAQSPAMVTYLDNNTNTRQAPNENYAREVMELHTLSVNGPYNQTDVQNLAKCFTGWTVYGRGPNVPENRRGTFYFNPNVHDTTTKTLSYLPAPVQGRSGPTGVQEAEGVIAALATHDWTAQFIATKLVRKFVADDPPLSLVDQVADKFLATTTAPDQIAQCVRLIFQSAEFRQSYGQKTRRPLDFMVAAMRAVDADVNTTGDTISFLERVLVRSYLAPQGHNLFGKVFPDGYPDVGVEWVNTNALLNRWNFGLNLMKNQLERRTQPSMVNLLPWINTVQPQTVAGLVDAMIDRLLGYTIDAADRDALIAYVASGGAGSMALSNPMKTVKAPELAAILIASPYFQAR